MNPTWFRFDGVYVWLTATSRRQKHRNWQSQPAVALSITDPDRPYRYLQIRGRVEPIIPDPEGEEVVRLAERYGMPQGPPTNKAGRIAVAIRPSSCSPPPSSWPAPPRRSPPAAGQGRTVSDGHARVHRRVLAW